MSAAIDYALGEGDYGYTGEVPSTSYNPAGGTSEWGSIIGGALRYGLGRWIDSQAQPSGTSAQPAKQYTGNTQAQQAAGGLTLSPMMLLALGGVVLLAVAN